MKNSILALSVIMFLTSCSSTMSNNQPDKNQTRMSLVKGYNFTPNSRACEFVSGWFSEFSNYAISPYRLSMLREPYFNRWEVAQHEQGLAKLAPELVDAIPDYQQFPTELLSSNIFNKYFVEDFQSLNSEQKDNFLSGAKMCHQYAEEAKGKIVINEISKPSSINNYYERQLATELWEKREAELCLGMEQWVEAVGSLDLSAKKYNDNYLIFTEALFNQVFYGRFVDLSANQRAGLSAAFSDQRVSFTDKSFKHCGFVHRRTQFKDFAFIFNKMGTMLKNANKYVGAGERARKQYTGTSPNQVKHRINGQLQEYRFIAEVLLREHQISKVDQFISMSKANKVSYETLDKFIEDVITSGNSKKPRLTISEQYILDLKRKALVDNYDVEQMMQRSLMGIKSSLPLEGYSNIYKSKYSVLYRHSNSSIPPHFAQIAQIEEYKAMYLKVFQGAENKTSINKVFDSEIEKLLSDYVVIDQSLLLQLQPNIEGINKSKLWLDDYFRFYQKYGMNKLVADYYTQLQNKRKELISAVWPSLEKHVASFDSSQVAKAFGQGAVNYGVDSKNKQGKLLISLVQERIRSLSVAERQEQNQQELNRFLARYYTKMERAHLNQDGKFTLPKKLTAPDEDALFKIFFRVVKSQWKQAGYNQYIRDKNTISMPVTAMGFKMRADTDVHQISIESCQQLSKDSYQCDYSLKYRVVPVHEDAQLSAAMNQLAPLTKSFLGIWQSGRKELFSHTFTFTENGWWSDDMAEAYRVDQGRMNKISAAWNASQPKSKTCLNYKGLSFSCW
ncbi:hypothetical protein KO525_04575 [Psychrosphaera sp. B3R10]|uniref:hypothetical protein n=1 Tax=unclassified Psychrosphaera TaxID=2641570 RepID=UPI001C07F932|nr:MULTISPECIES: hypothetical protein [unclassified Psychrosphaera]MBU2883194.1 hypothetical protein [Psychrosphaera sp. I2R16]MBU2988650.1 hypothetical protein [Psychrosphaera sp. B3R10]